MSDMVHNTLKKLRKGNNSLVCYGGCFEGGGGEWWDGLFKKGFSLRGMQRTSMPVGLQKVFFSLPCAKGSLLLPARE